jgi:hypothetical protein
MQKVISTSIVINAPVSRVWSVLTGFSGYHEWNPFIIKAEGKGEIGQLLALTLQAPGMKPFHIKPRIIKRKPEKTLVWLGHLWFRGLFDGEHIFELIEQADGTTHLIHGEKFRGILVGMMQKMIDKNTKEAFQAMNEALKKRCETPE